MEHKPSFYFLQHNFAFLCVHVTDNFLEKCIVSNSYIKNWDVLPHSDETIFEYILPLNWDIMYDKYLDWILLHPDTSHIDDDVGFYKIDMFLLHFLPSICNTQRTLIDPQSEYVKRYC